MRTKILQSVFSFVAVALLANDCMAETVTYEFTAKITDNGGVEYFAKGTEITGSLTYDRDARSIPVNPNFTNVLSRFESPKHRLVLQYQRQRFVSEGKEFIVGVVIGNNKVGNNENFHFRACDLQLPSGWKIDHSSQADSYGILLGNYPSVGVLQRNKRPKLPAELDLTRFNKSELTLKFGGGVRYPQGRVDSRATVSAKIISLKLSRDKRAIDQSSRFDDEGTDTRVRVK